MSSAAQAASALAVALTGGIGSGKSAATEHFHRLGAPIVDADVLARDVVRPGEPALAEIAEQFGASMLTSTGELDRSRMRALVFADVAARRRLEAILHPRVRASMLASVRACSHSYCVLAIPLLTEVRADYDFIDRVLVTDVSPAVQVQRVMQRDRCSAAEAERIIAVQAPRGDRLALADDVIDNDGELASLATRIDCLHQRYLRLVTARDRPA